MNQDSKALQIGDARSILIVRLFALGDIVLSFPIIDAFRSRYPEAWIGYLCREEYAEALRNKVEVDEVITVGSGFFSQMKALAKVRRLKPDLVLDLLSSPGSALLTRLSGGRKRIGMDTGRSNWCYNGLLPRALMRDGRRVFCYTLEANREIARMLGLGGKDGIPGPEGLGLEIGFPAADSESEWAESYFGKIGRRGARYAGIIPGAKYPAKSWPVDSFCRLSSMLHSRAGLIPLVIWGPGEEELADTIVKSEPASIKLPRTGIARLGAVVKRLAVLVGVDSGPKHLAVIQGVPTVTLFGPTDPRCWDPITEKHRVIYRGLECSPCKNKGCSPNRCLTEITPDEVLDAVMALPGIAPLGGGMGGEHGGLETAGPGKGEVYR